MRPLSRLVLTPLPWLGLSLLWTWPAAIHPISAAPGSPRTDLWESLWTFWLVAERLRSGLSPFATGDWLSKADGAIWPADLLQATLFTPVTLAFGPALTWTLLVVLHMTLRGWLGALIGAHIGGTPHAGWVSGAALAVSSVALSGVHNGASESFGDVWVLGVILFGLRLAPGWRAVVLGAGLLALSCVAHWYGGVSAFAAWALLACRSPHWRSFGLAGVLGLALALPMAIGAKTVSTAPNSVVGIKGSDELFRLRRNIGPADPQAFVRPAPFRSPDFREISRYGEDYWHSPYLGWVCLLLCAYGLRGHRLIWLVPVGALLASGPVLTEGGSALILPGRLAVPLPYFLIEKLPPFNSLSLLWKLGWMAQVGVAIGAAVGIAKLSAARPGVAGLLAAVLVLAEARWIAPTRDLPAAVDTSVRPALLTLADAPPGRVMVWPFKGGLSVLYDQTVHEHPVAGSLNFPADNGAYAVVRGLLRTDAVATAEARQRNIRYVILYLDVDPAGDESKVSLSDWAGLPVLAEDERTRVLRLW